MTDTQRLLTRYNELAPRKLKSWKGKKELLELKLRALEAEELAKKAPQKKESRRKGIGAACYALLAVVKYHEDDKGTRTTTSEPGSHPVGIAYSDILISIQKRFPESKVDRHHLRWYANRMRELDQFIPVYRERSTWEEEAA